MHYALFIIALIVGLTGASVFMHRLFETLLVDWDPIAEAIEAVRQRRDRRFLRTVTSREDLEDAEPLRLRTRIDRPRYERLLFEKSMEKPVPKPVQEQKNAVA